MTDTRTPFPSRRELEEAAQQLAPGYRDRAVHAIISIPAADALLAVAQWALDMDRGRYTQLPPFRDEEPAP